MARNVSSLRVNPHPAVSSTWRRSTNQFVCWVLRFSMKWSVKRPTRARSTILKQLAEECDDFQHDGSAYVADEYYEDEYVNQLLQDDDEDAALIADYEAMAADVLQSDGGLAAAYNSYADARKRLADRFKHRGFWPIGQSKGHGKSAPSKGERQVPKSWPGFQKEPSAENFRKPLSPLWQERPLASRVSRACSLECIPWFHVYIGRNDRTSSVWIHGRVQCASDGVHAASDGPWRIPTLWLAPTWG